MIHPQGLKCDLFITHGWAEGIFEFLDQVTSSWPYGAKAAYVCFLSNPQNLDIGGMIASPEESPFARALASATQVLAAPNHKLSIYTRAWCLTCMQRIEFWMFFLRGDDKGKLASLTVAREAGVFSKHI